MADWSLLPANLVVLVAERLGIKDVIRLRVVCTDWAWALGGWTSYGRPAPLPYYPAFVPVPEMAGPFMVLPNENGEAADYLCLQHLEEDIGHPRHVICPLPELVGRRCVGSSQDGWLVTLDLSLNPRMLNPLTREELPLPSLLTIRDNIISPVFSPIKDASSSLMGFFFKINSEATKPEERYTPFIPVEDFRDQITRRVVLSSAPPSGIAAVLYGAPYNPGHYMAFARVGDRAWTPNVVLHGDDVEKYGMRSIRRRDFFYDVFCNKADGRFYAINIYSAVFIIDLRDYKWGSSSPPFARVFVRGAGLYYPIFGDMAKYIVFSSTGHLYLIWKYNDVRKESVERINRGDMDYFIPPDTIVVEIIESISIFMLDVQQHKAFESSNSLDTPIPFDEEGILTACWVPVHDLGDNSILVGSNNTLCLHSTDQYGLRPNRVYFAEDTRWGQKKNRQHFACNAGFYDLKTKTFHEYFESNSILNWPLPIWFIPGHLRFSLHVKSSTSLHSLSS